MRRRIAFIVVAILVGMQFIRPGRTNPPEDTSHTLFSQASVTPEVASILQTSCQDCHSNRTRWPWYSKVAPTSWLVAHHVEEGRREMNFSTWAQLSVHRQQKLLGEICEVVREGEMPISNYLWMHPDAKLDEQQKKVLCSWADAQGGEIRIDLDRDLQ